MNHKQIRRAFILGSTILLVMVLALSLLLNINTYRRNYEDVITSTIKILAAEDVRQIEYAMKYGKEIDNFSGMDDKLKTFLDWREDIVEASIYAFDGAIYNQANRRGKAYLNAELIAADYTGFQAADILSINYGDMIHVSLPIRNLDNEIVAGFHVVVDGSNLNIVMENFIGDNQLYIIGIGLLSGIIIYLLIFRKEIVNTEGAFNRKGLTNSVIIALLISQCLYTGITVYHFNGVYRDNAISNAGTITERVSGEINRLLSIGLRMEDMQGAEDWLTEINSTAQVIDKLEIHGSVESSEDPMSVNGVLYDEETNAVGSVYTQVSGDYLRSAIGNLFLNALSVLAIAILIFIELIKFIIGLIEKSVIKHTEEQKAISDIGMIRFVTFFLLFSVGLSISFIPIISRELFNPDLGLPEGVSTAMPIQAEMLFTSIFAIISGYISSKKGWRVSFFAGAFVLCVGAFLSGIAANIWIFASARALVGIGYGLSWTSVTAFAGSWPEERLRTKGIGEVIAGIYAGSNCGVAIGAMMADYTSYVTVFNFTIVMTLVAMGLAGVFVKNKVFVKEEEETISTVAYLKNFKVSSFLVAIVIPAMVIAMFLGYFVPLFGSEIDLTQSNIGQLFLINGLMIVYLGPLIVERLTDKFSTKLLILVSGVMRVVAILIFALSPNAFTLIIAILILSVVDSFAMTVNSSHLLSMEASERFGRDKALGIISVFRKIGSLLGPTIFNFAFILGVSQAMYGIIGVYLVLMSVFLITAFRSKGDKHETGVQA